MIFVCGDTHMFSDIEKLESYMWDNRIKLTKDDYLIVLGDFGLIWYLKNDPDEKELMKWYNL